MDDIKDTNTTKSQTPPAPKTVQRIRTYAFDYEKVKGELPPDAVAPKPKIAKRRTEQTLAEIEKFGLAEEKPLEVSATGDHVFSIDRGVGTIISDNKKKKRWSLASVLAKSAAPAKSAEPTESKKEPDEPKKPIKKSTVIDEAESEKTSENQKLKAVVSKEVVSIEPDEVEAELPEKPSKEIETEPTELIKEDSATELVVEETLALPEIIPKPAPAPKPEPESEKVPASLMPSVPPVAHVSHESAEDVMETDEEVLAAVSDSDSASLSTSPSLELPPLPKPIPPQPAASVHDRFHFPKSFLPKRIAGAKGASVETKEVELPSVPLHIAAAPVKPKVQSRYRRAPLPQRRRSFWQPRTIIILAVAAILGASVVFVVQGLLREVILPAPQVLRVPSVITPDTHVAVPFSSERAAMLDTFTLAVAEGSSQQVVHLFPQTLTNEIQTPVSPNDVLATLEVRAPGAFVRSITNFMVGSTPAADSTAPFIAISTNSFDSAFSGMLAWESFMSADLAPLFGEPVRESFSLNARTTSGTVEATFSDTAIENIDARILHDQFNQERIVWGFINQNTIIITTNVDTFTALSRRSIFAPGVPGN